MQEQPKCPNLFFAFKPSGSFVDYLKCMGCPNRSVVSTQRALTRFPVNQQLQQMFVTQYDPAMQLSLIYDGGVTILVDVFDKTIKEAGTAEDVWDDLGITANEGLTKQSPIKFDVDLPGMKNFIKDTKTSSNKRGSGASFAVTGLCSSFLFELMKIGCQQIVINLYSLHKRAAVKAEGNETKKQKKSMVASFVKGLGNHEKYKMIVTM